MVKIGDGCSSRRSRSRRRRSAFAQPQDGYDRDTGEGDGHLFKIDLKGKLLADLKLGEGRSITRRHRLRRPLIWVPVAEYRPNSRSIIYRVDPATMKATEVFRFGDHIGGIVHNTDDKTLHGVSWGSRRFYALARSTAEGKVTNAERRPRSCA